MSRKCHLQYFSLGMPIFTAIRNNNNVILKVNAHVNCADGSFSSNAIPCFLCQKDLELCYVL